MMVWVSLCLAFAAFGLIAASMERHGEALLGRVPAPRARLLWRAGGYALLGISLLPCLLHWSTSVALAAWFGALTFAAAALGLMFTYGGPYIRRAAGLATALGLLLWVAGR